MALLLFFFSILLVLSLIRFVFDQRLKTWVDLEVFLLFTGPFINPALTIPALQQFWILIAVYLPSETAAASMGSVSLSHAWEMLPGRNLGRIWCLSHLFSSSQVSQPCSVSHQCLKTIASYILLSCMIFYSRGVSHYYPYSEWEALPKAFSGNLQVDLKIHMYELNVQE